MVLVILTCFISTDTHHPDLNVGTAAQRNHVVTLIAVAALAADRVCNYIIKTAAVILNLNFNLNRVTNNIAIVFNFLK